MPNLFSTSNFSLLVCVTEVRGRSESSVSHVHKTICDRFAEGQRLELNIDLENEPDIRCRKDAENVFHKLF